MSIPSEPPSPRWLLSRDGKTFGPMSSGQLKQLCGSGKIHATDLICREGSEAWRPAGEIRGLFPVNPQATPPAEHVTVHPIEEATVSASAEADHRWKTLGSFFCIINLAACGAYGLVKSPPYIVQTMRDLKESTDRVKSEIEAVTSEVGIGATVVDPTKPMSVYMKEGVPERSRR